MADDALVIFTPSGRRGRFETGTTVLDAARSLGLEVPDKLLRTSLTLTQPYVGSPVVTLSLGPAIEARDGPVDQLVVILGEYADHCNTHRPHSALQQNPPAGHAHPRPAGTSIQVLRRDRLGGLIHEYDQVA